MPDVLPAEAENLSEQERRILLSMLAVRQGSMAQRDVATVSKVLKSQVEGVKGGCGYCLHCLKNKGSLGRDRSHMLVSPEMYQAQGKKSLEKLSTESALLGIDDCMTRLTLLAYASGKLGLVWRVGEETWVWHREPHGTPGGEWFKGTVRSYDPVLVAHYLEFVRVKRDGTVEVVSENNCMIQLWRSDEYLSLRNPNE
jgi:hypothetical protein